MALIVFQGLSGLLGGVGLVFDPTGESLQIPVSWLENSPFDDYLIPGLILLIVLSFFPLVVFYGLLKKWSWSLLAAFMVGTALIIWIGVQILIIGYHPQPPLQLIYGLLGLSILVLALLPSVRRFYKDSK
jgi:FtsH-binding integral membrane protein